MTEKKVDYEAIVDYSLYPKSDTPRLDDASVLADVQKALGELYEAYYKQSGDVLTQRLNVEHALFRLMVVYDRYLG